MRMLSHEFRTPMALVLGYSELLEQSVLQMDDRDFDEFVRGLSRGSRRLMHLIEDFLFLSKLESGDLADKLDMASARTNVPDEVVAQVVVGFRDQAAAARVSLAHTYQASGADIAVEPEHLADIVRRLVDNAIKFSKAKGGRVTLSAHQAERFWVLEVVDDGIGIPADALDGIFQAFRQVDRAKLEQQGAGLGLAIARGLAELHGGRVTVASHPGQGSKFELWLPLALS